MTSHAAIKKNFNIFGFTLICHWSEFQMARKPNMPNKDYLNIAEFSVSFYWSGAKNRFNKKSGFNAATPHFLPSFDKATTLRAAGSPGWSRDFQSQLVPPRLSVPAVDYRGISPLDPNLKKYGR